MPWTGIDAVINNEKPMKIQIYAEEIRAGDICRPLRLLVTPDTLTLWTGQAFLGEAKQIARNPACLSACLTARMAAEGYRPLPHAMEPIARFAADTPPTLSREKVCRVSPTQPTLLTHSSAELAAAGGRGILREGVLVSAAWAMPDPAGDGHIREIALETAPAFRRRGLAAASAAALLCDLISAGCQPIYRCAEGNTASMALAHSLGLRRVGTEYVPAFRRAVPPGRAENEIDV